MMVNTVGYSTLKIQNWMENFSFIAMRLSSPLESTETISGDLAQSFTNVAMKP